MTNLQTLTTPNAPGKWHFEGEWRAPLGAKPVLIKRDYEVHTMPDGKFYFRVLDKSFPVELLKGKWSYYPEM